MQVLDVKNYGGEAGIRTLGTGISQYNGLAKHRRILIRYENLLPYLILQPVTSHTF